VTHSQPSSCQGASPLVPPECSARASRIPKGKEMKDKKTKECTRSAEKVWASMRVYQEEKTRLKMRADAAGLSLSEYMRRRFFGGRPLVAHVDIATVAELQKLDATLRHNFETLRQTNAPQSIFEVLEETLRILKWAIQKIGLKLDDRQKDQRG